MDKDKKDLLIGKLTSMENNTEELLNWCDGGGAIVQRLQYNYYALFYVPSYGGEPQFEAMYTKRTLDSLVDKAYTFT